MQRRNELRGHIYKAVVIGDDPISGFTGHVRNTGIIGHLPSSGYFGHIPTTN